MCEPHMIGVHCRRCFRLSCCCRSSARYFNPFRPRPRVSVNQGDVVLFSPLPGIENSWTAVRRSLQQHRAASVRELRGCTTRLPFNKEPNNLKIIVALRRPGAAVSRLFRPRSKSMYPSRVCGSCAGAAADREHPSMTRPCVHLFRKSSSPSCGNLHAVL